MRVGITFFHKPGDSIWNSGAVQQCTFLWMCLSRIPGVDVVPINAGHDIPTPPGLMLDGLGLEFRRLPDVIDQLDVLIQCYGQVSAADVERVKARGGRAIAYKFGNEYVIDAERIIQGKPSGGIVNGARFDAIWTNAQHMHTCNGYWETVYRCPVVCMPHIWSPYFVDKACAAEGVAFGYKPGKAPKRIGIYEPNINIVKTGLVPLLACESLWRRRPELIEYVLMQNSKHLVEQETFKHLCQSLDIVRAKAADGHGVCSFQGRARFPLHVAKHVDVVASHQWENGLNYAYYDALHGRYPLVHNSKLLHGVGYYYDGFRVDGASYALERATAEHDDRLRAYDDEAAELLASVDCVAECNVDSYGCELQATMLAAAA